LDFYSRLIALLKVLLPVTALAILSALFLLSRGTTTVPTLPFAESEVAARTKGQQVTAPFFSGTTENGDLIRLTAATARLPESNEDGTPATATELSAVIDMAGSGDRIMIDSALGEIPIDGQVAHFRGGVRIRTGTGYDIRTDELHSRMDRIEGEAPGAVEADGPPGRLTAGALSFTARNGDGPVHMLFKNGVRLVYDPRPGERP
jgi:lipopolysaccharide export system protein LptC